MQSLFKGLFSFLSDTFSVDTNPLILVNHLLQAYFFSLAVCNLIAFLLKLINFAYAEEVAASKVTQLFGLIMLFYIKIWNYYSGLFYIASIFSLGIVSLYVYDCCGNISEYFQKIGINRRDLALIISFLGVFSTTIYILWQIYKNTENPLHYPYSGIYILQVLIIVIGGVLRRRSILYILIGIVMINILIVLRHVLHDQSGSKIADQTKIPIEYLLYFLMAIDAEKRQRNQIHAQTYQNLFKSCAYLAAFSLLNDSSFQLELFLGGIYFYGLIVNK